MPELNKTRDPTQAKESATRSRAKRPDMRADAVQARLDRIVELRNVNEWSWQKIGDEVGLSRQACHLAYRKWLDGDRDSVMGEDAIEILQRRLHGFRKQRQILFESVAHAQQPGVCKQCGKECGHAAQPGVAIGAVRGLNQIDENEWTVRMSLGLMPRDLGDLRHIVRGRQLTQMFFDVLERNLVPNKKITPSLIHAIEDDLLETIRRASAAVVPSARMLELEAGSSANG